MSHAHMHGSFTATVNGYLSFTFPMALLHSPLTAVSKWSHEWMHLTNLSEPSSQRWQSDLFPRTLWCLFPILDYYDGLIFQKWTFTGSEENCIVGAVQGAEWKASFIRHLPPTPEPQLWPHSVGCPAALPLPSPTLPELLVSLFS